MDARKLKSIVAILEGTDVTFVEWRNGEERWTIKRGGGGDGPHTVIHQPMMTSAPAAAAQVHGAPAASGDEGVPSKAPTGHLVVSPFVGTFYRAPSPDSPAFVEVGDMVTKGQSLCIVEAMKLMNEIESDKSGRIIAIHVENGQPVEYGEPLFEIDPA